MARGTDDLGRDRLGKLMPAPYRAFIGAAMAVFVAGVWAFQWYSSISVAPLGDWRYYVPSIVVGVVVFGCMLGTNVILMTYMEDESTGCVLARAAALPGGVSLFLKVLEVYR